MIKTLKFYYLKRIINKEISNLNKILSRKRLVEKPGKISTNNLYLLVIVLLSKTIFMEKP